METNPTPSGRLFKALRWIAASCAIIAVLALTGAFIFRHQLGNEFRERLDVQLAKRGVHLDYRTSEFHPLSGLVIQDATLFEEADRKKPILSLSRMAVSYGIFSLLKDRKDSAVQFTTDQAKLTAYLEGQPFVVDALTSSVFMGTRSIELESMTGNFQGMKLDLTGLMEFASLRQNSRADVKREGPPLDLKPVVAALSQLPKSTGDQPLTVQARGIFTHASPLPLLEGKISGRQIAWRGSEWDAVNLEFKTEEVEGKPVFVFPVIALRQNDGKLDASGRFNPQTQILEVSQFKSSVDLWGLAEALGGKPVVPGVKFLDAPTVTLSGNVTLKDPVLSEVKGSVETAQGWSMGEDKEAQANIRDLKGEFMLQKGVLAVTKFTAIAGGVPGHADRGLALDLTASMNLASYVPAKVDPAAPVPVPIPTAGPVKPSDPIAPIANLLNRLQSGGPNQHPILQAKITLENKKPFTLDGTFGGKAFKLNGLEIDNAAARFATTAAPDGTSTVTFPQVEIQAQGGTLSAIGYVANGQILHFDKLTSDVDIIPILTAFGGNPLEGSLKILGRPAFNLVGDIALQNPERSAINGTVRASGLEIPIAKRAPLVFRDVRSNIGLREGNLSLDGFRGSALGGAVNIDAVIRLFQKTSSFAGSIKASGLSLGEVSRLAGSKQERSGRVDLDFAGSGGASISAVNGRGTIRVSEAELLSVPIFRGLRPLFGVMALGGGQGTLNSGATLTSSYVLDSGSFRSDDIQLNAGLFAVDSAAQVNFDKRTLHVHAAARTNGPTRVISAVAGKVLEIEAEGTFDNYHWRLLNLGNLMSVDELTGLPAERLASLLGEAGIGAGEAANLAGELSGVTLRAVRGLTGLPFGRREEAPLKDAENADPSAPREPAPTLSPENLLPKIPGLLGKPIRERNRR